MSTHDIGRKKQTNQKLIWSKCNSASFLAVCQNSATWISEGFSLATTQVQHILMIFSDYHLKFIVYDVSFVVFQPHEAYCVSTAGIFSEIQELQINFHLWNRSSLYFQERFSFLLREANIISSWMFKCMLLQIIPKYLNTGLFLETTED